ncbi:MAG: response regulator [Acidobacteria bacterium]|nr:response regulator [Acidobacteriota bacterium]
MSSTCAVQPRILIADDQPDLLDALRLLLKGEGIHMEAVTSPDAALIAVASGAFDLLLMDLITPATRPPGGKESICSRGYRRSTTRCRLSS